MARAPRQLDLFSSRATLDPQARPWSSEIESLASRLDPRVYLGASSWTFPGWAGICYPSGVTKEQLERDGLELYARYPLFRTVGIDSSYYKPIERARLEDYAAQLPTGFRCIEKVWEHIVAPVFPTHERYGLKAGRRNDTFLNAEVFFEQVHRPHLGLFERHLACYVLEFPPTTISGFTTPSAFVTRLARFLDEAPHGPRYAVELRNRELLTAEYFAMLRERNVAHVYNYWSQMPTPGAQLDRAEPPGDILVARLMLSPGSVYDERKAEFEPFNRLVDPSDDLRDDAVRLAELAIKLERDLFVTVSNKAEGCSPLTVLEIARTVVKNTG